MSEPVSLVFLPVDSLAPTARAASTEASQQLKELLTSHGCRGGHFRGCLSTADVLRSYHELYDEGNAPDVRVSFSTAARFFGEAAARLALQAARGVAAARAPSPAVPSAAPPSAFLVGRLARPLGSRTAQPASHPYPSTGDRPLRATAAVGSPPDGAWRTAPLSALDNVSAESGAGERAGWPASQADSPALSRPPPGEPHSAPAAHPPRSIAGDEKANFPFGRRDAVGGGERSGQGAGAAIADGTAAALAKLRAADAPVELAAPPALAHAARAHLRAQRLVGELSLDDPPRARADVLFSEDLDTLLERPPPAPSGGVENLLLGVPMAWQRPGGSAPDLRGNASLQLERHNVRRFAAWSGLLDVLWSLGVLGSDLSDSPFSGDAQPDLTAARERGRTLLPLLPYLVRLLDFELAQAVRRGVAARAERLFEPGALAALRESRVSLLDGAAMAEAHKAWTEHEQSRVSFLRATATAQKQNENSNKGGASPAAGAAKNKHKKNKDKQNQKTQGDDRGGAAAQTEREKKGKESGESGSKAGAPKQ